MSFTYRGLKATLERHAVTDQEIDSQIQRLQQQAPRTTKVEGRPTQNGDEVLLDYAGFCDGVQFPGGTAEKQTLVLGSGTFIPGFEEQLLDKNVGDEVVVNVTFPTQYHSADLAGKAAEFRCRIHEIRAKSLYELDDTFAREVGGCETFEAMRAKMAQTIQAYADERSEMDLQDRLIRQAAESMEFTPSEEQIQQEITEQIQNLTAQLAQQGLSLEMYCQFTSTTEAQLRENARANAEASVRIQAAIDQIVYSENMVATQEEIDEAMAVVARQNRMTLEQLKPFVNEEFEAAIVRGVLTSKSMGLVRDSAEITEIMA